MATADHNTKPRSAASSTGPRARVMWYINLRWAVLLIIAVPNLITRWFVKTPLTPLRENLLIAVIVGTYNGILWLLIRQSRTDSALRKLAVAQIALDTLAITALIYRNGGIESHSPILYIIPILATGALFSAKAMRKTACLVIVVYTATVVGLFFGLIAPSALGSLLPKVGNQRFFNLLIFTNSTFLMISFIGSYFLKMLDISLSELKSEKARSDSLLETQKTESEYSHMRITALIQSIGEGLVIVDSYGNVVEANEAAERILGYKKEHFIGQWFPKALPAVDDREIEIKPANRPLVKALETGRVISKRLKYLHNDGHYVPVYMTAAPFVINGQPAGGVVVFRDFTHEAQIDQAKDEFISIVSHQLRTPLTAIRLFTEMILGNQVGKLQPKQRDYLEKVEESTLRMIALVGGILNISRIELGRLKVEPTPTSLVELVKNRVEEVMPLTKEGEVKIAFSPPKTALPEINVDQSLLGEVIHNLLTNAIRYSKNKEGLVKVAIGKESKGYVISVQDNGIGIPNSVQDKIFTRFFRADNAVKARGGRYRTRIVFD